MRLAVIGAGVFGSWIALTAVREGFETILIERVGPAHDRSSSGGPSRIIRSAYGDNEIYTVLAQRSLELWRRFLESTDCSHLFRRTGVLWLADTTDPLIYASRAIFERRGIKHEFLDADQIRSRVHPMVVTDSTVALFEPDGGALLAEPCVRAVAQEAIAAGARYIVGRADWSADQNCLRVADNTTIESDVYIFACGSWLPQMFPDVLGNLIFPTRQEVFFFDPGSIAVPGRFPIWVDQTDPRIPYGFPDIDGAGIKVAFHRPGPQFDPDSNDRKVTSGQINEAADYLRSRFRLKDNPVCRRADICHYENTSNGDFLIDRHPSLANVWFAGGGSGHGFKHAPSLAEYVIDAIQRGNSPEPRFRLAGMGHSLNKTVV
jgi:sarcosine oxidase